MQIQKLLDLANNEVIEPETIRKLYPEITEEKFNKLEALITIKTSNYAFENFYTFENVVRALNNIIPKIEMIEGAEPEWVWYACEIMKRLRPNMELSSEVIEYIMRLYADEGIYFLHPYITNNVEYVTDDAWVEVYKAAKHKAENGPFPLKADSFINRQAIELMKMELYSKNIGDA